MKKTIEIPEGYEAALERCKQWVAGISGLNPGASPKEVSEYIFPELAESEDEKIRKDIIAFLQSMNSHCNPTQDWDLRNRWLPYLERQKDSKVVKFDHDKEQKPKMIQWTGKNLKEVIDFTGKSPRFDEWFKSWEDFENYVHSHEDILKLFCEDGSHYEVPIGAWIVKTPDGYNTPSRFRFIQKPAEWDEDDNAVANLILKELEQDKKDSPDYSRHFSRLIDWFTHRFKSFHPQPKQEWSEEDEEMLRIISNRLDKFSEWATEQGFPIDDPTMKQSPIAWLKSLRPQPKQEWSEGTKKTIDKISDYLKYKGYEEDADFIRHLCPQSHWKPSEKQLLQLRCVISGCSYDIEPLVSLEKQLKQL